MAASLIPTEKEIAEARSILKRARADLGHDLGGFSVRDLLMDNMPGSPAFIDNVLDAIGESRKPRKNPTRREGYRFGTSHFVSREAAIRYYAEYGENAADVDRKLREGIIAIGPPKVKRYEKLSIIPGEGRYQIERIRTVRYQRKNPGARVHSAKFDRCVEDIARRRGRKPRNAFAVCTASLGGKAFRKRARNPSRYKGRNMYKMTAQRAGGKLLTLVQGNKFAERGSPVYFADHASAWATAQWLQDQFPALRRYTILVTNK